MEEMQDYQFYVMYNSTIMNKFDGGEYETNGASNMCYNSKVDELGVYQKVMGRSVDY